MTERPRILIVRLGAMGDVIHALPAALALRRALPEYEIGWIIERRWLPLLCAPGAEMTGEVTPQRPLVENIHTVDTRGWRKALMRRDTWKEISGVLNDVRATRYDIAMDVQGAIKSAGMAALSNAPVVWGFAHPREKAAGIFYSRSHETTAAHVVDQNLSLAQAVGASISASSTSQRGPVEFVMPIDVEADAWAQYEVDVLGAERVAIINPGAGWGAKCWPAASYAEVARWLLTQRITPLINFGPGEDGLANDVHAQAPGSRLLQATLPQLIAMTRRSSLFVGGDTGPMHLAAALGVPIVALFGPTDPARNGPYCGRNAVLRNAQSVTSYSHVSNADSGLLSITAAQAIAAAERLLES